MTDDPNRPESNDAVCTSPRDSLVVGCCSRVSQKVHRAVLECEQQQLCSELTMDRLMMITGCRDTATLSDALRDLRDAGLIDIHPRNMLSE